MKALLHKIRMLGGERGRAVARFLALLCVLGVGAAQADSGSVADCLGKINPEARDQIMQAIASQPALAGNETAIQAYIGVLAQESGFRNVPSGGTSKDCPGVPVSYGRGQVNYYAHRDTIHSAGYMNTPQTGNYCADLAAGGQWLLDNPDKAQQISAKIFADGLNACGGDVGCALKSYCGGCDAHTAPYNELVGAQIQKLGTCGDGSSLFAYTPTDASGNPTGPTTIVRCPDLDLAEALNKANQYYLGQSLTASRAAYEAGEKLAREQTLMPRFEPFGPVAVAWCLFDVVEKYQQLIMGLLGKAGGIYNTLIAFANELMNLACQYVAAAINNVLNSICIPLPNLPGLPGFGGPDRKSCNGISLADLVSVSAAPRLMMNNSNPVQRYQQSIRGALQTPMSRSSRSPAIRQ